MTDTMRDRIKENALAGSIAGVLVLALALLSLFVDSRTEAAEKEALAKGSAAVLAGRPQGEASFDKVYALRDGGGSYGVVISARSAEASGIFGAVFSPKGELKELRLLGSCSTRLPEDGREALEFAAGSSEVLERAGRAAASEADS